MYHESHYIRSKIETNGTTRLAGPKTMPTRGSYAPYIYISNAIIGMNESKILKLELFDVLARVNTWMRRCDDATMRVKLREPCSTTSDEKGWQTTDSVV